MTHNIVTNLLAALVYSVLGIVIFIVAFFVIDRLTPGSLWHEIIEEHNTALAVLGGCVAIAMAIIIAASIV